MSDLEKAARMALEALEYYQHRKIEWDYSDDAAITAIREALAEQPAQHDVDWEKLYRLEVKKKEALAAKYERDTGKKLTRIVPMAEQPAQHDYRTKYDRPCYKCRSHFCPGNCKEPEHLQQPASKPWVGLNAKDLTEIPPSCFEGAIWADAKLKEKNT